MTIKESVINKLKKILALADRGATEGEVQAAMHKAQELAIQNNIDLGDIDITTEDMKETLEVEKGELASKRSKTRRSHHLPIAQVLMECFDVRLVWTGGSNSNRCCIVGEKTDVTLATYVYHWLDGLFPRLHRKYTKTQGIRAGGPGDTLVLQKSYYRGVRDGIIQNNKRQKKEAEKAQGNKYALVLVKKEAIVEQKFNDLFPKAKASKARRNRHDFQAGAAGFQDGRNIKLNGGLTGRPNRDALS